MKILPQKDWVLVEAQKTCMIGGIHIPTAHQEDKEYLIVKDLGPDVKLIKKESNIICYRASVFFVNIGKDGDERKIGFVKEDEIIAVVEGL